MMGRRGEGEKGRRGEGEKGGRGETETKRLRDSKKITDFPFSFVFLCEILGVPLWLTDLDFP
jgi:hypothetical protein